MGWLADSILRVLRERPGEVVTTPELTAAIYGDADRNGAEASIRTVIHNIRKHGQTIETVWGYRVPKR